MPEAQQAQTAQIDSISPSKVYNLLGVVQPVTVIGSGFSEHFTVSVTYDGGEATLTPQNVTDTSFQVMMLFEGNAGEQWSMQLFDSAGVGFSNLFRFKTMVPRTAKDQNVTISLDLLAPSGLKATPTTAKMKFGDGNSITWFLAGPKGATFHRENGIYIDPGQGWKGPQPRLVRGSHGLQFKIESYANRRKKGQGPKLYSYDVNVNLTLDPEVEDEEEGGK